MNNTQSRFDVETFVTSTKASVQAFLIEEHGPLMTFAEVAGVLGISVESFRNTLFNSPEPAIRCLRASRIRCGRRVRIPTAAVVRAFFAEQEVSADV